MLSRLTSAELKVVEGHSLAVVRIAFGVIGLVSMARIVVYGWVESLYVGPTHRFTYPGLRWVPTPNTAGMYTLVVVVSLAAAAITVGWFTRPALVVFTAAFAWIEFIDATTYLNHYWFVTLLGLILVVAPVDTCLAVRPRPRPVSHTWVWLVRMQVAQVYVFAGLAKLTSDWMVHALPLRLWLPARSGLPIVGPLLEQRTVAFGLSWAGALFDCSIVALLCWRRTRRFAWCGVVGFHVATWVLFPIGVFPWLMIAVTTVFFEPNWPAQLAARIHAFKPRRMVKRLAQRVAWRVVKRRMRRRWRRWVKAWTARLAPQHATGARSKHPRRASTVRRSRPVVSNRAIGSATIGTVPSSGLTGVDRFGRVVMMVWVPLTLLIPLRHHLIEGPAYWTGEGYRFAWNVLLTEKGADTQFRIRDLTTGVTTIASGEDLLTPLQHKVMSSDPELIRQTAHLIAHQGADPQSVAVYVDAFVSLNGRAAVRLIDPTVDLSREPYRFGGQQWILPAPTNPPP
jgi:vitamin K-dependent gamma-carboxylase